MVDLNLRTEGYIFSDEEFTDFCSYFYKSLQKRLVKEKRRGNDFNVKRQLCIASNIIGDLDSKRSPTQASLRKDLKIITEAAGILSEDQRDKS